MKYEGLVAVVKRDCPTCELVAPLLRQLAETADCTVYSQDDPSFPEQIADVVDDTALDASYAMNIEIVPTLIRYRDGQEIGRTFGWDAIVWQALTGVHDLGADLPDFKPGCGSLSQAEDRMADLKIRHGHTGLSARQVALGDREDAIEACYDRDWTDGLPVVPPTDARVMAMLDGTNRRPDEILGEMPPNLAPCTIEKIAINAVMAGCRPDYMPVVVAAVEAVLDPVFCLHGVLATTRYVGPVLIVNGPIARRIGMNARGNVLGQGNRANATIGRAVQLVVRNVGGGKPGGVDRATLGNPGKLTYCFAEDEAGSAWEPFVTDRGLAAGTDAVTAFAGAGLQGVTDERARTGADLANTLAASIRAVDNINKFPGPDVLLVVCPEHERTFAADGWDKARLHKELLQRLSVPADSVMPGCNGIREGVAADKAGMMVAKLPPEGLMIVRAGGGAGKFSGLITGWTASSPQSSRPVTKLIEPLETN